eukprot:1128055-Pyramimonas_sp.AAC.1
MNRNRIRIISCVCLSNPKLWTRSAARSRIAKLFVLVESSEEVLSGFCTQLALRGATVLVVTGIDFKTSGASVCRIQSSELGLLLELGLRLLYCSSHPERCCGFFAQNSGGGRKAAGLVMRGVDSQTSDAFACRIQRSNNIHFKSEC